MKTSQVFEAVLSLQKHLDSITTEPEERKVIFKLAVQTDRMEERQNPPDIDEWMARRAAKKSSLD